MEYYYLCSYPLSNNSIIEPGNWGRIINTYTTQTIQKNWLVAREYIFESVRLKKFPDRPSRLEALFLCQDLSTMNSLNKQRPMDLAYKVQIVDESADLFKANMDLVSRISNEQNVEHIKSIAEQYWRGNDISSCEILTTAPIKILKRLS